MKKSMSIILLGSALLLPNNNSAEASYQNNEVAGHKDFKKVEYYVTYGEQSPTYNGQEVNRYVNEYLSNYENLFGKELNYKQQVKKLVKLNLGDYFKPVEQAKPEQPSKPVEQTKPEQPSKPVEQTKPEKPSKPVEQAKPEKPSKPVEQTKPETPSKPVEQVKPENPTPEEPSTQQPTEPEVEKPSTNNEDTSVSAIEKAVLDLTNAERQKAGLQPLQADTKLMNSARQKSNDMATNNYFSHTSPTYGSPFDQMKSNGITYRSAAENIAMGQRSAEEVVKGWMESPGHRQNILTPEFTHIGIGYDANGKYWTQQFIQK